MPKFVSMLVISFIALLAGVCSCHAQAAYSLTISTDRDVFKTDSTIPIKITLTNTSQKMLSIHLTNPDYNYSVEVRDKGTGRIVPDTDLGREVRETEESTTRDFIAVLRPGESTSDGLYVGLLRNMSQPGEYTIVIMREAPEKVSGKDVLYLPPSNSKNFDRGVIRSNEITVKVAK